MASPPNRYSLSRSAILRFDLRSDESQQSCQRSETRTAADVHKILVIFGDPASRWMLNQIFVSAGYDVVSVPYSPAVIEEVLFLTKPDLVVLDLGRAGEAVQALCRQIRKESRQVPLFVLGSGDPEDRILMLDLGADDYITKPLDATEFLARVRTRIRWWGGHGQ